MTRVQGGSRPTHEYRIRNHLLQTRRGLQYGQQFRAGLGKRVSLRWLLVRKPSRHETDDIRCDNYIALSVLYVRDLIVAAPGCARIPTYRVPRRC